MKTDLDEQIVCAIREKAAKSHLAALESDISKRRKKRRKIYGYVAIAASLLIIAMGGTYWKLCSDMMDVGYAFDPVEGQSGGSEITALMEAGNIDAALDKIANARAQVAEEMMNPSSDDHEYMTQLQIDSEELDLLEAVCNMRKGNYFKAKGQLTDIASGGGHFETEAKELLDRL